MVADTNHLGGVDAGSVCGTTSGQHPGRENYSGQFRVELLSYNSPENLLRLEFNANWSGLLIFPQPALGDASIAVFEAINGGSLQHIDGAWYQATPPASGTPPLLTNPFHVAVCADSAGMRFYANGVLLCSNAVDLGEFTMSNDADTEMLIVQSGGLTRYTADGGRADTALHDRTVQRGQCDRAGGV